MHENMVGIQLIFLSSYHSAIIKVMNLCNESTAGGAGEGLRSDALSRRVYPRGAGHENQPDRGKSTGREFVIIAIISFIKNILKTILKI